MATTFVCRCGWTSRSTRKGLREFYPVYWVFDSGLDSMAKGGTQGLGRGSTGEADSRDASVTHVGEGDIGEAAGANLEPRTGSDELQGPRTGQTLRIGAHVRRSRGPAGPLKACATAARTGTHVHHDGQALRRKTGAVTGEAIEGIVESLRTSARRMGGLGRRCLAGALAR